jgi:hypothetical protein
VILKIKVKIIDTPGLYATIELNKIEAVKILIDKGIDVKMNKI